MEKRVIEIENVKKEYRLGTIGGGTLSSDIQSWWARKRGKEDPNSVIGAERDETGKRFYALDGINLQINKGEAVGIIGTNGAGKSTLLKLLTRVTAPTDGRIRIRGRVASMLEVGTGFHPELTGRENIYMNGAILGMKKAEIDEKIEDIIEFSECRQFIDTPVKRYSSGMYVKLAFSVAVHLDAEILIMDEVLAVGDMKFQQKCLDKMSSSASTEGKTILYVSHNMSTIRQLCTRCVVLDHGKIIYDGEVEGAIEFYIGLSSKDRLAIVDFSDSKRPPGYGNEFKIESISFRNKREAVFYDDEEVEFEIHWIAKQKMDNLYVRFEVENTDGTPVGMAESDKGICVESDTEGVFSYKWNVSNLVEGKYQVILDAYTKNQFGCYYSYDHPYDKFLIEIIEYSNEDGKKSSWDRKAWNSVRLNTLNYCEENHKNDSIYGKQ